MSLEDFVTMGESSRIDYVVREQDKLDRRLAALMHALVSKGIMTAEEIDQLVSEANQESR